MTRRAILPRVCVRMHSRIVAELYTASKRPRAHHRTATSLSAARRPNRQMKRKVLLILLLLFAAIQFARPNRANPTGGRPFDGPENVKAIFTRACFDCHSNETRWPLYSEVAPFSWLVANHVEEGRRKLNFSTIAPDRIPFDEVCQEMEAARMPMKSYLLVHWDAKLTPEEVKAVCAWAADQ